MEIMSCPLCGSGSASITQWMQKDGCELFRCAACTVGFRWPVPSASDVSKLYEAEYFNDSEGDLRGTGYLDYISDESCHRRNARRRLHALHLMMAGHGRLLDVGSAAGFFVDEASRNGWQAEGIDLSKEMSEYGRQKLALPIVHGAFLETNFAKGQFDAISMWDYLEHTREPLRELTHAHELLRSGGLLTLSTGDLSSFIARMSGKHWHLLTPRHHFFYFTLLSIRKTLEGAGFSDISITHPSAVYSLRYLLHKARIPFGKFVPRGWCIPLNLGDIMTVTARA